MDDGWFISDDQLARFSKARERIVGRVEISELSYIQGPQSSEEELVVWKRTKIELRGHQSVSLSPKGTMRLLFRFGTIVSKTYSR